MSDDTEESISKRNWKFEVQDSRILTVLSYVFPSVLGGVVVLVVLLFSRLLLDTLLDGNVGQAVLYLVISVASGCIQDAYRSAGPGVRPSVVGTVP